MFRIDQTTAVTALPAPSAAGTPGFFTGGNPATGQAATIVSADWLNLVQEELMSFLTAAGIAPNKTSYGQVLQAVQQLFAASAGDATKLFQSKTPPAGDNSNSVATTAFVQGFAGGRKVVILSAMNWTVPAGVTLIWISACAAGGGSAGSPNIPANNIVAGGAGGGAGQFVLRYPMAVTPGQVLPCLPGAAGVAGAIGGAGGNGSNTIVGSLTLNAGAGGQVGSSGAPTQAWPGQPGGNGFPNGEYGQDTSQYGPGATGGRGGGGPFGASGAPGRGAIGGVSNLIAPSASYGYGVGGAGAGGCYGPTTASGTTSGSVGAAGMPGIIIIEY
ncbi:glycine-rich domain-containing protein [Burkholderia glumae]|uniref:glycine-rich domain-containing protein n=1 Tax=Burkholderia glumae TaxID=337 RepID=UPI00215123E9|nr:phage tail protein [Burkholderia glumae]